MKKRKLAIVCATSALASAAFAATPPTDYNGYLSRAIGMYADQNYPGCIDQMKEVKAMTAPASIYEDADYYIAMSKFRRGDTDAAEALHKFIENYPASVRRADITLAEGSWFFYHDRFTEALPLLEKVEADALDDDSRSDLLYRRAFCCLRLGDYDRAASELQQLRSDRRYSQQAEYYTAYIDYATGNYTKARRAFEAIPQSSRFHNEAQFYICQLDFHDENYSDVRSRSAELLKSRLPENMQTELYRIAGESNFHLGYSDDAVTNLNEYISRTEAPERSALYALGVCQFTKGDYNAARQNLSQVTNVDDELAQSAYLYAGQAYLREDNVDAAALAFRKAYDMPYDENVRETAFYNYAIAQSRGGRTPFSSSVKLFQDFLNDFPNSKYADSVEDYIINSYLTGKDYDNALSSIQAINRPSKKMLAAKQSVLYHLGVRELTAGKTAKAAEYLTQADNLAQYDTSTANEVKLWLAETRYKQADYKQAKSLYSAYTSRAGKSAANYGKASYGLGYANYQLRDYSAALTAFSNAANASDISNNTKADCYNRIADCYYYKQDFSKAESYYSKALASGTADSDYALYQQAMMRGLQGNVSEKISLMDKLIAAHPSSTYASQAAYEKALAYESLGKNAQAQKAFESLISNYPQTAEARKGQLQLAMLLANMGKSDESRRQYENLVKQYPSSDEAKVAVDDLKRIYAAEGRLNDLSALLKKADANYEINDNEMAALTFEAAESDYLNNGKTTRLKSYLKQYPSGNNAGQAAFYIAEAANQSGNTAEAAEYVAKALSIAPDAAYAESALAMQGNIQLAQKQFSKAKASFTKMEQKASSAFNKSQARLGLLRAETALADYPQMLAVASQLVDDSNLTAENRAEALYARAVAEMNTGKTDKALTDLSSLSDRNITSVYGSKAAVDIASYYYNNGNLKKAETAVNKLLDSASTHQYWMARGFILLSDIYKQQGDTFQAREYLESLKENYPGNETDIKEMIEQRLKALK